MDGFGQNQLIPSPAACLHPPGSIAVVAKLLAATSPAARSATLDAAEGKRRTG